MRKTSETVLKGSLAVLLVLGLVGIGYGQTAVSKKPTAEDWAALANLPDFNGVWERGGGGGGGRGAGRGGRGRGGGSVLQPTAEYAAIRDQLNARGLEDTDAANCLPPGMPGIMTQPYPMEFLLTPGKVTVIIEAYTQVRHIYTDGRPLPEDPNPNFFGSSIGHWEGDTLVVETIGFSPLAQISRNLPHSDEMKIVERFSLSDPDTMVIETTITDPEALEAPYTTTSTLRRHRDWTIAEYICEENNRNFLGADGKAGITLENPGGLPPVPGN